MNTKQPKPWYKHKLLMFSLFLFGVACVVQVLVIKISGGDWELKGKSEEQEKSDLLVVKAVECFQNCEADIRTTCPEGTSVATMSTCLLPNLEKLSPSCRKSVDELKQLSEQANLAAGN